MSFLNTKKKIVVHSGTFHSDDVFAVATLRIKFNDKIKVTRTREMNIIDKADIVCDVGNIYDPENGRFDHHQTGGACYRRQGGQRSFLLWRPGRGAA